MVSARSEGWVAGVRRFSSGTLVEQRCELCGAAIRIDHRHLMQVVERRLLCCCQVCAILFGNDTEELYRLVPTHSRLLAATEFSLTDAQWEAFQIPIDMAFFFNSTPQSRVVAFYPGPAGVTESLLDLSAWEELRAANPVLAELEPDVEALLINRAHGARDYYKVPIDRCYALTGIIRLQWRGLTGGTEAWTAIRGFFSDLQAGKGAGRRSFHA